jgi:hypothetical protein
MKLILALPKKNYINKKKIDKCQRSKQRVEQKKDSKQLQAERLLCFLVVKGIICRKDQRK